MKPRDIAHWISEEHAHVQEQMYALRRKLAVPPINGRAAWLPELRGTFQQLTVHLNRHMSLEETDGYMREIVSVRPTLTKEVDGLLHQHTEMKRLMTQIEQALEELAPADELLIRHAIARVGMLLAYVEQHKKEEEHLVMAVFTNDIGVGD